MRTIADRVPIGIGHRGLRVSPSKKRQPPGTIRALAVSGSFISRHSLTNPRQKGKKKTLRDFRVTGDLHPLTLATRPTE